MKTSNRQERRKAEFLAAARRIVRDSGFRELQMATVAAGAGVAVGTIYRYFPSKAELCAALVASVSQRELDVMTAIADGDGSADERLRGAVETFSARAFRSGRLAYAMIAEPVDPAVEDMRLRYRADISRLLCRLLIEGVAEGTLSLQHPETASACITGAFMEGVIGPLAPGEDATAAEIADAVAQIGDCCLTGVAGSNVVRLDAKDARGRT